MHKIIRLDNDWKFVFRGRTPQEIGWGRTGGGEKRAGAAV
jgi:hypothetical protein